MDLSWFITIPGMLITGGVLLLIIALIIFILTSGKKNKKEETPKPQESNLNNMEIEVNIEPYLLEFSDFDSDKKITMEEMSSLLPFMK